jgi:hypothetical protein
MREFTRDWRRWSRGERLAAVAILAFVALGTPALLAMNLH